MNCAQRVQIHHNSLTWTQVSTFHTHGQCRATIRNDKDSLWAKSLSLSLYTLFSLFTKVITLILLQKENNEDQSPVLIFFVVKWDEASKAQEGTEPKKERVSPILFWDWNFSLASLHFFFMFILVGWQLVTSFLLNFKSNNALLESGALTSQYLSFAGICNMDPMKGSCGSCFCRFWQ